MATVTGFQLNTTIQAAFWIYKPDPAVDPVSKEEFIEVNSLQRVEANAENVLGTITSVQIVSNVLIVFCSGQFRPYQQVILRGLQNSTFLNGQVVTVSPTPTGFTAPYIAADYGPQAETSPDAEVIDTTNRTAYLYYPEMGISTAQGPRKLDGAVAARFIYDMEVLFGIS